MKRCCACKQEKPVSAFNRCSRRKDGLQTFCAVCERAYTKAHYKAHKIADPQYYRDRKRRRHLKELYGLTVAAYEGMIEAQNNCCAACFEPLVKGQKRAPVDHDHVTGKVRAVLCQNCNVTLGHAKDEPGRLRALASYLEKHRRI